MESNDLCGLAAFTQCERSGTCGTELSENACASRYGSNDQKGWQGGTATVHERGLGKEPGKTRGIVEGLDRLMILIVFGVIKLRKFIFRNSGKYPGLEDNRIDK